MDRNEQYNYKSRLYEIVPSTRFGQALASLFYLKRHKKRDDYGRAPVVASFLSQSTLQKSSPPPPPPRPIQIDSLK